MTDNEIIKALECCPYQVDCVNCNVTGCDNSPNYIMENALDLINRQKAEIEVLSQKRANLFEILSAFKRGEKEGVQQFADRLCEGRVPNDPVLIVVKCELKEMVGGNNG